MKPRPFPLLLGLGLVTGATLALEVLDTRLLSVITWYSLAFLVIAMGLFGLTAGAVHVYLQPAEFDEAELARTLARHSRRFALAVPASLTFLLFVPLTTAPVATTLALFVAFGAALALPFYPAGVIVAAVLTRSRMPIGLVYAVDLLGAAIGAPAVALCLRCVGGETSVLIVGVVAAVASLSFAAAGKDRAAFRAGLPILALAVVLTIGNALTSKGLQPIWVKGRLDVQDFALEVWNSHSRIRVWKAAVLPGILWGAGSRCTAPAVRQHIIEIDAGAGTTLYEASGDMEALGFLTCDVTNTGWMLRSGGAGAIIGVGGTRDLQAALYTRHAPVVGIEFNGRMLEILRGPIGLTSGVPTHPAVRLVEDEGRSFMARTDQRFQVIQASLVDTWAATGAGAHALGENGLYTLEAWRTFLDRLEPDGVLTVSRWTQETDRLASLAMGALFDAGFSNPRSHLAMIGTPDVVNVILSKSPFTGADVSVLDRIANDKGFLLIGPDTTTDNAQLSRILGARSAAELALVTLSKDADYRPPTDDRPYFFNVLPLEAAWRTVPMTNMGSIEGNLLATRTLVLSFFASLILVVGSILIPLSRRAMPQGRAGVALWAGISYFSLLGVGFMLAEVTLLQRLGLVLGNPSYSLVVVLTSLVFGTGLGALASDRLPLARAPYCFTFPLLIAAALSAVSYGWPSVAQLVFPAATSHRVAFSMVVTTTLGVLMGAGFPAGIRIASRMLPDEAPWFWGVNGIGSVLASSAAVMLAERYGLSVTLYCSAACYAVLCIPIFLLVRARGLA